MILFFAFFLPPERKRRLERRLRGREEFRKLGTRRRRDRLVRQERPDLAAGAAVALLPAALRAAASRPSSASTTCTGSNAASRGSSSRTTTTCATIPATATTSADFYGKKVVLLVRHPADVAVSQFHQWKFRMRPHKKALNNYPAHGTEVDVFDFVMDEDAGLPKVIDFMNAWAQELPRLRASAGRPLRGPAARHRGRAAAGARVHGRSSRPTPSCRTASPSPASRTCASSRRSASSGSRGSRMRPRTRATRIRFKVRRAKVGGYRDYFDDAAARGRSTR